MKNTWPDNFDFENDETCRKIFRPFIELKLEQLKVYDAQRPADATYIFNEHARRIATDVKKTCEIMGLGKVVAQNMYWAALPHDIGKLALPVDIWDKEEKPDESLKQQRRSHTRLGAEMVERELGPISHPFYKLMTDIMRYHHEQMDGKGYLSLSADQLSMPVRLVSLAEAFDGWSTPRPHFDGRDVSIPAVLCRIEEEKSAMFDPTIFKAFTDMKMAQYNRARQE